MTELGARLKHSNSSNAAALILQSRAVQAGIGREGHDRRQYAEALQQMATREEDREPAQSRD